LLLLHSADMWCYSIVVKPILHIGEYSLIVLQYQRTPYISLRVSAYTDTPAVITINSSRTRQLKHVARIDRMWLQMRLAFLFTFRRTDCCVTRVTAARWSRHQRHPAAQHAAWCFNYRQARQTHANMSKGQTGSWNLTHWFTTLSLPCFKQAYVMYPLHVQSSDAALHADHIGLTLSPTNSHIKLPLRRWHRAILVVRAWRLPQPVSCVGRALCQWAELCGGRDRPIRLHNPRGPQQVSNSIRLVASQRRTRCQMLPVHSADVRCQRTAV